MKRLLLIICSVLSGPGLLAESPLLHYTFKREPGQSTDRVADASGNRRDAYVSGMAKLPAPSAANSYPCLDNSASEMGASAPESGGSLRYDGPGLGALTSFTVTLWYKTVRGQSLTQGTRLFEFLNVGRQPLLLAASSAEGNLSFNEENRRIVANGTANGLVQAQNEWIFIAVTHDGTSRQENTRLYVGAEDTPLTLIAVSDIQRPLWNAAGQVSLIFGANETNGRALAGWLDDIRIYGDALNPAGALSPMALQTVMNERATRVKK
jgi:hypothetical protein